MEFEKVALIKAPAEDVWQALFDPELMRLCVAAQRAGNLAALFTDQGSDKLVAWRDNPGHAQRLAGHQFASGPAMLVANRDRFGPVVSAVTNTPFRELFNRYNSNALVVDVDEMVYRVLAKLGLTDLVAGPATQPADRVAGIGRLQ